jgi:hypothetical protein
MRQHRGLKHLLSPWPIAKRNRPESRVLLRLEELETRALLSASTATASPATAPTANQDAHPLLKVIPQAGNGSSQQTSAIAGYTPQQIQQIYGFSQLAPVNGTSINGAGETIAIVDAYYDPDITNDANTFSSQFNLPLFNNSGGPSLKVVASGGGSASSLPQDSTGEWPLETSLDVEWAHAMAPQANILLVEAPDQSNTSLFNAVKYAAAQPGVAAVSMSWGDFEFSGETSYDSYFVPPSSNPGVTFVAASGDYGALLGPMYPATSPYVLAVGGTTLGGSTSPTGSGGGSTGFGTTFGSGGLGLVAGSRAGGGLYNGSGSVSVTPAASSSGSGTSNYPGESAWSGSGGGASAYEGEPSYQSNQPSIGGPDVQVYNYYTGTYSSYYARLTPDVSYNADPNTGYAIYDSIASPDEGFSGGWTEVGGTSAGAPQWSAIVALADQERGLSDGGSGSNGAGQPLDTDQVQNTLYNTLSSGSAYGNGQYSNVFHDITTGSNGYSAGPGYDLATGLGTPIVNNLVPLLAGTTIPLGQLPTIQGSGYGGTSGAGFGSTFSSLGGLVAGSRPGAGLYSGSGSLSLPPAQGVNGLNGPSAGSTENGPTIAPRTPLATPLTSSTSTTNAATTSTPTEANNFLGNISTLASASPFAAAANNTTSADSTNVATAQDLTMFGASGWNGPASSWRLSSLGLTAPGGEQRAGDLPADWQDGNDSSAGDAGHANADASGVDLSVLDVTAPPLLDGEPGDSV